jgi:hypothetical protein
VCLKTLGDSVYFGGDEPGIGIISEGKIEYPNIHGINNVLPNQFFLNSSQNQLIIATNDFLYLLKGSQLSLVKKSLSISPRIFRRSL